MSEERKRQRDGKFASWFSSPSPLSHLLRLHFPATPQPFSFLESDNRHPLHFTPPSQSPTTPPTSPHTTTISITTATSTNLYPRYLTPTPSLPHSNPGQNSRNDNGNNIIKTSFLADFSDSFRSSICVVLAAPGEPSPTPKF